MSSPVFKDRKKERKKEKGRKKERKKEKKERRERKKQTNKETPKTTVTSIETSPRLHMRPPYDLGSFLLPPCLHEFPQSRLGELKTLNARNEICI